MPMIGKRYIPSRQTTTATLFSFLSLGNGLYLTKSEPDQNRTLLTTAAPRRTSPAAANCCWSTGPPTASPEEAKTICN